ncbi:MAG: radical SAM protein [Vicinamibacterales bacterium]
MIGQGERTFAELVDRLADGSGLAGCPGTAVVCRGDVVRGPSRPLAPLDSLPAHDYGLIDVPRYFRLKGAPQVGYVSSQGCRFRCAFCADPAVFARAWTGLAPARIAEEAALLQARYGMRDAAFQDETFFTSAARVEGIAAAFATRGVRCTWTATIRADQAARLGDAGFGAAVAAGLRKVMIGVESGSEATLHRLRKDVTLEQVEAAADLCARHGLAATFNFIVGFPGEDDESVHATLALAKRLRRQSPSFDTPVFYYRPCPGNPLADEAEAAGEELPRASTPGGVRLRGPARAVGERRALATRRALQVLHAPRVGARCVALAAPGRRAVEMQSRLVRRAAREVPRRARAAAAAGVVMDVLLAHGYFLASDAAERRIMRPHPPLGLLYLSSYLKRRGLAVGVFDATFREPSEFETLLREARPGVVGLAANLMTKRAVVGMMAVARRHGAHVVVGGPDPPHHAEAYLDAGADVVAIGEGERTLEALLPALQAADRDAALAQVTGIVHRRADGVLVRTPPRPLMPDLDAEPPPDRQAVDLPAYLAAWRRHHGFAPVSLITSRGCPYTCTWCSRSVCGQTHRRRSVAGVADEVEDIAARYRPDHLWCADDVFGMHRAWTVSLAAELDRRRIRLPFECISRADRLDDSVVEALDSLGCYRVWIGSESGSQRVLDRMQRRTRVEQVHDAAARLRRRGIQVGLFIMLGYDGEEDADLRETVTLLKRTAPDVFLTTVSYPIAGTPYFTQVADRVRAPGRWADTSDRDLVITGRRVRRYYDFARRWMTGEVDAARHWQAGRYARSARSASSAVVGRIGMALTAPLRES